MHICTKEPLSSSLSQYSAARPASERYRATAHVGDSCPALASASNDQAAKAAMSVLERVENYSENLTLVTRRDRAWVRPSIQMQTTLFSTAWRSPLTLPRNSLVLRQELCNLLVKGAIERIPVSELENGFYSRYFVGPKRDDFVRF